MPVTIKDIAKLAGVSNSTVSRCLNNSPRISQKTKEKVKKIAADLDFELNNSARSLSTKKTGIIAIIYQQSLDINGSKSYISELFLSLRLQLEKLQLDAILVEAINPDNGTSNTIRLAKQGKVDGFLFLHTQITPSDLEYLSKFGLPGVQVHFNPQFTDINTFDFFLTDNIHGGYLAGKHLLERGCRKLVVIGCSPNFGNEFDERTSGFIRAIEEKKNSYDTFCHFEIKTDFNFAYKFTKEHLSYLSTCDGIFAEADVIGAAIILSLKEEGIRVPEDIKVIGYDDSFYGRMIPPFLTTIHQPKEEITEKASKRIKDLISKNEKDNKKVQEKILPSIIVRQST